MCVCPLWCFELFCVFIVDFLITYAEHSFRAQLICGNQSAATAPPYEYYWCYEKCKSLREPIQVDGHQ